MFATPAPKGHEVVSQGQGTNSFLSSDTDEHALQREVIDIRSTSQKRFAKATRIFFWVLDKICAILLPFANPTFNICYFTVIILAASYVTMHVVDSVSGTISDICAKPFIRVLCGPGSSSSVKVASPSNLFENAVSQASQDRLLQMLRGSAADVDRFGYSLGQLDKMCEHLLPIALASSSPQKAQIVDLFEDIMQTFGPFSSKLPSSRTRLLRVVDE